VTIYRQWQSSMTSGTSGTSQWALSWPHPQSWANPLMGYLSSSDTLSPISMHPSFESPEQAIFFCERNGWKYRIQPHFERRKGQVDNQYAYNFVSKELSTRMKQAGPRKSTTFFACAEPGKSHFVNLRRSQFGAEPWRPAAGQTDAAWTGPGWPAPKEQHHSH
jgi:hypothetical protein